MSPLYCDADNDTGPHKRLCERRGGELEKCRGKENEERKIINKTKYEKTK